MGNQAVITHYQGLSLPEANFAENANSKISEEKFTFLCQKDEQLLLAIPLIGIVLTLFLWILGRFDIGWRITDMDNMIGVLVFMDGVHIMFSFVALLAVPELRQWAKSKEAADKKGWAKGLSPLLRTIAVAGALAIIIYCLRVSPDLSALRGMATMLLFLEVLGPAHHTLSQMKGISFCYNSSVKRNSKFSPSESKLAAQCEKFERLFFNLLLCGEILYWVPEIFEKENFKIPAVESVQLIGAVLAIASTAAILVNALYFPNQEKSNKFAFLARVALFPLKMVSIIAGLSVRAAHGTEYLVVYKRMVDGSKISRKQKLKIFAITAAISIFYAVPFILTNPSALEELGMTESDLWLSWAVFGTFILRFAHYYLDANMFRMSDPVTRAAVTPLLLSNPSQLTSQVG